MAGEPILDLAAIDVDRPMFTRDQVALVNPHRGHMALLDAIVWVDDRNSSGVAVKRVRNDEFWVPGHIPGKPVLPGVLMVEAAAQLSSFLYYRRSGVSWFAGFTRIEETTFRGLVRPGDTLFLLATEIKYHIKRFKTHVQGVVNDQVVFEGKITGMVFPDMGEVERQPVGERDQVAR